MKNLIVAAATLCMLAACNSKTSTTECREDNTPPKDYLFTYFAGESDGLRLAHSTDGITWEELGSDSVFLVPTIGKDSLMRDPSVAEGPDGTFHMVWTSGWNDRGIAYSSTKDFINWTPQKEIPVMAHEPETLNCWAPEVFYDKPSETYYIYWASTIPDRHSFVPTSDDEKQWNHRIYLTTTKDFEIFTPTELWFNPAFSTIDAAIVKSSINGEYIMFVKNENSAPAEKNIRQTRTKDIKAGFPVEVSESITGEYWAEGPAPLFVNDTLYVYFDKYMNHSYGAVMSTDNGETWTDISDKVTFPEGMRHGTAFAVDPEIVSGIKTALQK